MGTVYVLLQESWQKTMKMAERNAVLEDESYGPCFHWAQKAITESNNNASPWSVVAPFTNMV